MTFFPLIRTQKSRDLITVPTVSPSPEKRISPEALLQQAFQAKVKAIQEEVDKDREYVIVDHGPDDEFREDDDWTTVNFTLGTEESDNPFR